MQKIYQQTNRIRLSGVQEKKLSDICIIVLYKMLDWIRAHAAFPRFIYCQINDQIETKDWFKRLQ